MGKFIVSPRSALEAVRSAVLALCQLAPLVRLERRARRLELKRPPGFAQRSRRLRARVLGRIGNGTSVRELPEAEIAPLVARLLQQEAEPARRVAWAALGLGSALLLGCALLVLALAAISSSVRARVFPTDVAAKVPWHASSAYPGHDASGIGAGSSRSLFFHTNDEADAFIELTFPRTIAVRSVHIVNRSDCCQERALPLNVEALSDEGAQLLCQRRAPFSSWSCQADGVRTKRLRIRHPGRGILHLARIEVYE